MGFIPFFTSAAFIVLFSQISSAKILDHLLAEAAPCKLRCEKTFTSSDLVKSCSEGCRLFIVISLSKNLPEVNETIPFCQAACTEAFINETEAKGCYYGCQEDTLKQYRDAYQSIHLLTPLVYVRSAYSTVMNEMKQLVSSSWTVYVQEDSDKMVVMEIPKAVQTSHDLNMIRDRIEPRWQEEKPDWMDCISRQSGIPRWLLVIVLFGFIIVLLWLCCAAAVTAPSHYLSSSVKKYNVGYGFLSEPEDEVKLTINSDEEAPPLPQKVTLI